MFKVALSNLALQLDRTRAQCPEVKGALGAFLPKWHDHSAIVPRGKQLRSSFPFLRCGDIIGPTTDVSQGRVYTHEYTQQARKGYDEVWGVVKEFIQAVLGDESPRFVNETKTFDKCDSKGRYAYLIGCFGSTSFDHTLDPVQDGERRIPFRGGKRPHNDGDDQSAKRRKR